MQLRPPFDRCTSKTSLSLNWSVHFSSSVLLFFIVYLRLTLLPSLALPLWVDSVHHSALARLIAEQGTLPASYRPYADVDQVYYHLGYHLLVVVISKLTGLDIETTMLWLGQIINVLVSLTIALLAVRWTKHPLSGLVVLVITGTVSLMPAYYVTWGRYTQLLGLAILPLAMMTFDSSLRQGSIRRLLIAGVWAGLIFFVHYRVLIFLATFVLAYLCVHTLLALCLHKSRRSLWIRTVVVFIIAICVSSPWLWRVVTTAVFPLPTFTTRFATTPEANAVPWDLLQGNNTPILIVLACLSSLVTLLFNAKLRIWVMIVWLWLLFTMIIHNPNWFGLPLLWILDNFSAIISLFFPLSLLIACGGVTLWQMLERKLSPQRALWAERIVCIGLLMIALWTGRDMVNIINPVTVLVESDDLVAMEWIRASTPDDTKFLVNMRLWLPPIYAGTDGGYWIPNLTKRRTTMPIVFYLQGSYSYWHDEINALAQMVEAGPHPNDPVFLSAIRARGVTHVYFGAKGGPLPLEKFLNSPNFQLLYQHHQVHIFALRN